MSAEQELREAVDEYRNCGSTYEGISWSATELLGDAVGRLLEPPPALDDETWDITNEELALIERGLTVYRAWLIGGDA